MDKPTPVIVSGKILVSQDKPDDDLIITHRSPAGETTIRVPADKLQRWALRLLRDEVFV